MKKVFILVFQKLYPLPLRIRMKGIDGLISIGALILDVKNTMTIIFSQTYLYNDKNRKVKIKEDFLSNRL